MSPTVESTVPAGTSTGVGAIDRLVEVVGSADPAALASVLRLTEAPCTNELGIGGPPKCGTIDDVPAKEGGVPRSEGTIVEAFPISTCESEWHAEADTIASIVGDEPRTLFAVVELDDLTDVHGSGVNIPVTHALIFERGDGDGASGMLFAIDGEHIRYIDVLCGGSAAAFLTEPLSEVYGPLEVILRGPAFSG
ncbi:MAG: hypothetical protein R3C39_07885 [Dehalococcoidia bacterium]